MIKVPSEYDLPRNVQTAVKWLNERDYDGKVIRIGYAASQIMINGVPITIPHSTDTKVTRLLTHLSPLFAKKEA